MWKKWTEEEREQRWNPENWPKQIISMSNDSFEETVIYDSRNAPFAAHLSKSFVENCLVLFKFKGTFTFLQQVLSTPSRKRKSELNEGDFSYQSKSKLFGGSASSSQLTE